MRAEEAARMGKKERKAKEGGREEEGKGKGKGKNEYFSFRKQAPSVVIHRRALFPLHFDVCQTEPEEP